MYKIYQSEVNDTYNICIIESNVYIPLDSANSDYQRVLDDIIEQGADCFEGDIPTELQTAADAKLFNRQLVAYTTSIERLARYIVADGRAEVTESLPTGEQVWNEETMEMDDVMADFITVTTIDALDATVEVTTYDIDTDTSSTETITNPLITTDVSERSDAQAIVDATPSAVVDAYNAL
jgi:hypothetical protein